MSTQNDTRYAAPALDKGLDILECLARSSAPLSQAEVSQQLGRKPNEIFRMLARLEARGYILRDPNTGQYELSLKLYHLSHSRPPIDALLKSAIAPMQALVDKTGHPAHLSIIDRDGLLVLRQIQSKNPVSISIAEGSRFPLLTTTSGRLLLGSLPQDERERILEKDETFNNWSKATQTEYLEKLAIIAEQGYNTAPSWITKGVSDIVARVGQKDTGFLATITISCVSSLIGETIEEEDIIKEIQKAASAINQSNGTIK